jgi:hypothetical protein
MSKPEWALAGLALLLLVLACVLPALPQDPLYHRFADQRTLLGIGRAMDVLSNAGFLVLGIWGLAWHLAGRLHYANAALRRAGAVFFAGIVVTAFGSGYYHLAPDDARLVWDRLGMVVVFAGVLGMVVAQRVSTRTADVVLPFSLVAGVLSVLWYARTGSITPYAVMQFGGLGVVAALLWLPAHGRGPNWAALVALYALAKVFELWDVPVFRITDGIVSGHTLKHLLASLTALAVLLPLARARRV